MDSNYFWASYWKRNKKFASLLADIYSLGDFDFRRLKNIDKLQILNVWINWDWWSRSYSVSDSLVSAVKGKIFFPDLLKRCLWWSPSSCQDNGKSSSASAFWCTWAWRSSRSSGVLGTGPASDTSTACWPWSASFRSSCTSRLGGSPRRWALGSWRSSGVSRTRSSTSGPTWWRRSYSDAHCRTLLSRCGICARKSKSIHCVLRNARIGLSKKVQSDRLMKWIFRKHENWKSSIMTKLWLKLFVVESQ